MQADLTYDGTTLVWKAHGTFNATSGLPGHQSADQQTVTDHGPIPEGWYSFPLILGKEATMTGRGILDTREGVESLPSEWNYRGEVLLNIAWGPDRVRLNTIRIDNPKARHRGGFYLHDSTKGFSHGCIEVDPLFFSKLRAFIKQPVKQRGKTSMVLHVKYPSSTAGTYGGTKKGP
jgi:hypothetical protein